MLPAVAQVHFRRRGCVRHAWKLSDPFQDPLVRAHDLVGCHTLRHRRRNAEREKLARPGESRIDVPQRLKRPQHQPGADQQYQRQGDLRHSQNVARAAAPPGVAQRRARPLRSAGAEADVAELERRNRAEQRPGGNRDQERKHHRSGADADAPQARQVRRSERHQQPQPGIRQPDSQRAAGDRQGDRFGKQSTRQAPPAGPQRRPHGELLLPGSPPGPERGWPR